MRLRMLLCGNTLVVSVCCEGTSPRPPNCRIVSLRKTIPSFRKLTTVHLAPLRRGLFLCRNTWEPSPAFRICFGAEEERDLPQHDETRASLRRGFFCTEKGALNSSVAEVLKRQTPQPIIALCQMRRCRTGSWFEHGGERGNGKGMFTKR
jgi:hypothetical protein